MNKYEADREAAWIQRERDEEAWKARIIGSATEMDLVIDSLEKPDRLKIMKLVADLTDAGLELANPHQHYDLPRQTKDMVVELAQLVENAIEEYINE